ncbi:hypothetical protein [Pseudoalteromonas umbrosa]|uniref:hypothetical protein n=1 Tax=Pseudoalteromonas umbrosa TaxID=3048489 RepID=UPI0024C3C1F4|nr:hypothetical protein [Pseudoalteromonas sp. B95]MDK1290122.1 hypothetical protein [Pseudoalteromonas sp. B95]
MARTIKVLGIDPSMSNFGFVLADVDPLSGDIIATPELKLVQTSPTKEKTIRKSSDDLRRCRELFSPLAAMVAEADIVCSEMPLGSQNASAMKSVGICLGLLSTIDKPFIQVMPEEVKLAAVGSKTATKAQMIEWAYQRHPDANWLRKSKKPDAPLTAKNEHIADAVAVIAAATKTDHFKLMSVGFK